MKTQHRVLRLLPIAIVGITAVILLSMGQPPICKPLAARLAAATVVEASWEILENTDTIINRCRETTISLDDFGDSVLNSVCDIGATIAGFMLASRLPVTVVVALIVVMELGVGYAIRDNLDAARSVGSGKTVASGG